MQLEDLQQAHCRSGYGGIILNLRMRAVPLVQNKTVKSRAFECVLENLPVREGWQTAG